MEPGQPLAPCHLGAEPKPQGAAIIAVLDDFAIADLHEVLIRDGWYLPEPCQ